VQRGQHPLSTREQGCTDERRFGRGKWKRTMLRGWGSADKELLDAPIQISGLRSLSAK
jgi:hypothetical protein